MVCAVNSALHSMVAATYVRDIGASRAFYEQLGFREHSSGQAATSAWCSLHHGLNMVLLTSTTPALGVPALPLLFYFFFDDVDEVVARLRTADVPAEHMGYPAHAMGGEVRLADPDGNTVLIGQRTRSMSQPPLAEADATSRFSLLRAAAAIVAARGGSAQRCQAGSRGSPCASAGEVKLADPRGDSVWACLDHADEILVVVRGAHITRQDGPGIAEFLARRAAGSTVGQAGQ
jgi:catechol 2,3-dioxygenase-like lactoylglutathione lyase family enzyme